MASRLAPRRLFEVVGAPLLFLGVIVVVWKIALAEEWVSTRVLPHPEDIVASFVDLSLSDIWWDDVAATLWESVAGFLLGSALGLALAIPSGLWTVMRRMLHPYAIGLQVTPRIAIAPLIIAWVGFGYSSKIWIAAIISFFPVYVNALTGMLTVDEDAVREQDRLGDVVGDQERGRVGLRVDLEQLEVQALARELVDGGERLVEQQHVDADHQETRERDALLHAA